MPYVPMMQSLSGFHTTNAFGTSLDLKLPELYHTLNTYLISYFLSQEERIKERDKKQIKGNVASLRYT